jgi:chromatin assembly factor 1 subunit B
MKCQIPEISWHNRDPVLSVDFQPKSQDTDDIIRLASGGAGKQISSHNCIRYTILTRKYNSIDSHVLIWHLLHDEGATRFDLAADLTRHQRAVNCVRWSPNGELLASCDDESFIFIWKQKLDTDNVGLFDRDDVSDGDKEIWISYKTLRGHMEDIYDLSFSPDSQFIMSGSVDNTAMIWDIEKAKSVAILPDHKGFVQGVAWDPLNKYLASLSTDRIFRIFDVQSKKLLHKNFKSLLPVPEDSQFFQKNVKLFHDDTLQTFFRRLTFSPEGSLIVTPCGFMEIDGECSKPINATYIYTRYSLKE